MKVYRLESGSRSRNWQSYRYLGVIDPEVVLSRKYQLYDAKPLAGSWRPFRVKLSDHDPKRTRLADAPGLQHGDYDIFTIRQRAVELIGDALLGCGELLPLESDEDKFYLFHPTRVIDGALDLENSRVNITKDLERIMTSVDIFRFRPEKFEGALVFKIAQPHLDRAFHHAYATEEFKELVERHKIKGWMFTMVWDSEDPDFHDERWHPEQWEHVKRVFKVERGLLPAPPPPPPPPPPSWREFPLGGEDRDVLAGSLEEAFDLLRGEGYAVTRTSDPGRVVEAVAGAVERLRGSGDNERAALLGALWGEQVCRAHGWRWAMVGEDEESAGHAVVSPDGSAWVPPLHFVWGFFQDPALESTALLLFNMLGDPARLPSGALPGAYIRVG